MAKKNKPTAKEIMDSVVDLELLKKRKDNGKKKKEIVIEEDKEIEEKKWFQLPMLEKKFTIKDVDNKFYAHYSDWKENVHIGPYETESELKKVIDMYVKETKKSDLFKRKFNIDIIHSCIL